jgi:hypothetical protein
MDSAAPRPAQRARHLLSIENGLFTVAVPGVMPLTTARPYHNGLVHAAPEASRAEQEFVAVLRSAMRDDDIWITVEVWDTTPPLLNLDEWQDAAEITIGWPGGQLRIVGTEDGPYPELPLDDDLPAGPYRLRVAGRNRDDGEARAPGLPVEEYLLQLWPAVRKDAAGSPEETGEVLLKAASALGAHWRDVGRRQG